MAKSEEKKELKKQQARKIEVLRIRKSNTKNILWEGPDGKKFIQNARSMVKKSEIDDGAEWFIIWEIVEQ